MRVKAFLIVVGILSAAALGCSDDEDSAERLYGTWDISAVGSYHTWEPDGT